MMIQRVPQNRNELLQAFGLDHSLPIAGARLAAEEGPREDSEGLRQQLLENFIKAMSGEEGLQVRDMSTDPASKEYVVIAGKEIFQAHHSVDIPGAVKQMNPIFIHGSIEGKDVLALLPQKDKRYADIVKKLKQLDATQLRQPGTVFICWSRS